MTKLRLVLACAALTSVLPVAAAPANGCTLRERHHVVAGHTVTTPWCVW